MWMVTVAWLLYLGVAINASDAPLTSLKLNELGDFLAGAFAPLAFAWLIYGYFLQRSELELQRDELRANTLANEEQAAQLGAHTEVLRASFKVQARQADIGTAPIIIGTYGGWSNGAHKVEVRNHGASARHVHLRSYSGDWTCSDGATRIHVLKHDECWHLTFKPKQLPETALMFEVSYCSLVDDTQLLAAFAMRDGTVVQLS